MRVLISSIVSNRHLSRAMSRVHPFLQALQRSYEDIESQKFEGMLINVVDGEGGHFEEYHDDKTVYQVGVGIDQTDLSFRPEDDARLLARISKQIWRALMRIPLPEREKELLLQKYYEWEERYVEPE